MPRLNNDERNQVIGMLIAGMYANAVSQHFGCTRKTSIYRDNSVSQETFNQCVCTDRTSVKFSLDFVEQQGGIGAAVTCTSDVLIGILLCLPMNVGLTFAIPTDAKEFITVRESVLPILRASLSWTISEVVQS